VTPVTADPRRAGWLHVLQRELLNASLEASQGAAWSDDAWFDRRLAKRGVGVFPMALDWEPGKGGRSRDILLWSVANRLLLIADAARQSGALLSESLLEIAQLRVLAASEGLFETLADLELGDLESVKARRALCREIETRLVARCPPTEHPLLDSNYHRFLVYTESRSVLRLAQACFEGTLDESRVAATLGESAVVRLGIVEAVQGLVLADGHLDTSERRLVRGLIGLGGFTKEEEASLELADLPSVDALAREIRTPTQRVLVLRVLIAASLVDRDRSPAEDAYVDELAEAFGISAQEVARLHLDAGAYMDARPDLSSSLSRSATFKRINRSTQRYLERLVKQNIRALVTEAREMGDLVQLLSKKTREPLTAEEQRRMEAQLKDLLRAIPSLAIFAAPGGALLLPILARVLPFKLLPDAFLDQDEGL
jgi:uncharacterized tellurite resistance protein B-like protein